MTCANLRGIINLAEENVWSILLLVESVTNLSIKIIAGTSRLVGSFTKEKALVEVYC